MADADPETLEAARHTLSAAGYRVSCAGSVPETLEMSDGSGPDLVIVDDRLGSRPEKAARRCGAVLCLSGFSLPSAGTTEGTGCLGKPLLASKVAAALGRADQSRPRTVRRTARSTAFASCWRRTTN